MAENLFVGVWRLVSCDAIRADGTRVPIYGKHPAGQLCYDAAGNMSVHIMKAGRAKLAYVSTYAVDTARRLISHRVVDSISPKWAGTIQARFYEFRGDNRLFLSTEPIGGGANGHTVVNVVWERVN